MTSVEIRTLLQPPSVHEADSRALAHLNATYHSLDDLEHGTDLDELVEQARKELVDLDTKLAHSQSSVDAAIVETREKAATHLNTAQELSLLRHSLADELAFLSGELVSSLDGPEGAPTLLEDLETLHRSLKELESVKGYVQVVEHALKLSEAAVEQVRGTESVVVSEYEALQAFVVSVATACTKVDTVASQPDLHILAFLEGIVERTWRDIKSVLSSRLLEAAEKLKWPLEVDYTAAAPENRKAFETSFGHLLKLQNIGQQIRKDKSLAKEGLYAIQALVQPIALRFKYHFEGTRQTNRLDKPEWYFTHIANEAHEHRPFMESIVQSLVASSEYRVINAWREFTLQLLPVLERKLRRTVPALLAHPPILAHTIYQALAFDTALRDEGFDLPGTSAATPEDKEAQWEGISELVLGKKEWFEAWVEGERQFAMDQYLEIISASDAWLIADEEEDTDHDVRVAERELRPTNSARRMKALVEQVTDRYSPLPQYSQRTRFLIVVQLPLLESYHARISSSLDAFETLSSSLMRAVPGALGAGDGRGDSRRLTGGVEGVQRLCKALVSAQYLANAMETWGEDLFFLELWAEISRRSNLRTKAEAAASLPNPAENEDEPPEGTIFEELVRHYKTLVNRAEDMIVHCVTGEVETGLKPHLRDASTQTTPASGTAATDDIALAQTLLAPLALLSSHLTFLRGALPRTTTTALYRRIASQLGAHLLQRQILYRGRTLASVHEGKVVLAEAELWVETARTALKAERARVEAPWRAYLLAARLLAGEGPEWEKIVEATFGTMSDTEWEETMLEGVGLCEMPREEVQQVLRRRADCER
ncbi:RAD50-interacting protein 1 [Trametes pubescens]|uniref:RAD50-interacting protein 1 n=1 Tax=Trametes pubescens TaxID=154538 RepID=A0A1M2VPV7_TRAPU|nr:RAD50-interacting protein 1 [Trametes pubescens]